jgi:hypothetical protein
MRRKATGLQVLNVTGACECVPRLGASSTHSL